MRRIGPDGSDSGDTGATPPPPTTPTESQASSTTATTASYDAPATPTASVDGSTGSSYGYAPPTVHQVNGVPAYGAVGTPYATPHATPTPTPSTVQFEGAANKATLSGALVAGLGLILALF